MVCSRKQREGGFRFISADALNLEAGFWFRQGAAKGHGCTTGTGDGECVCVWTLGRSLRTSAQKYTDICTTQVAFYDLSGTL